MEEPKTPEKVEPTAFEELKNPRCAVCNHEIATPEDFGAEVFVRLNNVEVPQYLCRRHGNAINKLAATELKRVLEA
jgi:hypothetical protein